MAITDIQATVLANTGKTPTANSIEDAQKFVVSTIPKDLLKWTASLTDPASHGGNESQGVNIVMPTATDSILSVSRNGFSAEEVPYNMKGFIANSSSLHLATSTYPKYYLDNAVTNKGVIVSVKPVPTDSETARVLYVDYSKIDDNCDLRNAIINYASSREFTALAASSTFPSMSWGKESPPNFTPPTLQQPDWADVENWITTEEDSEMLNSRINAIQSQISEYTARLQSAQAEFNSELQDYQSRLNETVQLNQGQIAQWQAENGVKLNHYLQMSSQHYNWAVTEIKTYIENNTKTLDKVMELQRGK
tara:strand:- start:203 stop:1123 length:921 start_codon:yes stop_codon:yes gene_type:complete